MSRGRAWSDWCLRWNQKCEDCKSKSCRCPHHEDGRETDDDV